MLKLISSMATRQLLAALAQAWQAGSGIALAIESVGGVDAAKRVAAAEPFDIVLLASDAIDRLIAAGHLRAGSRVDWANSAVAAAVPAGCSADINSVAALKQAVLDSPSISYSTGPSGTYLTQLFADWGLLDAVKAKLTVPPPGVSVGSLLAKNQVALGFQQRSEFINVAGITVLGDLPEGAAYITTFSSGIPVGVSAENLSAVNEFLNYLNSPQAAQFKALQGMTSVVLHA